jgi:error-prone DNA polymerase
MFKGQVSDEENRQQICLPSMSLGEHVVNDYATTGLSIKAHPVSFVRDQLEQLRICSTKGLQDCRDGQWVKVAGLVLVRQRPGTAGGVCFMTIEDETGVANLVIFENLFEKFRKEILQSRLIMVEGKLQIVGEVIHVIVSRCYDFSKLLRKLTSSRSDDIPVLTLARPDEKSIPPGQNKRSLVREVPQETLFPQARNFR